MLAKEEGGRFKNVHSEVLVWRGCYCVGRNRNSDWIQHLFGKKREKSKMFGLTFSSKYRDLKREYVFLEQDYEALKKKYDELEKKLKGERVCGGYCQKCKYCLKAEGGNAITGHYTIYECELNCKCKDFERI